MSNHIGARAAILFILVGGLGVGTLALYVRNTPEAARVPEPLRTHEHRAESRKAPPVEPKAPAKVAEKPRQETDTVRVPTFGVDISDMALAAGDVPVPAGKDAMKFLAERIAKGAGIDGARAMDVEVRDHVATVNYSPEVEKGMGSMEEGAFLRGLQVGFGQFTDIDRVAVESNGVPLTSGHVDLSEPMPVVRPGEKASLDGTDPKRAEP